MRAMHGVPVLAVLLAAGGADARIRTEKVEYRDGETVLEGFLAFDDAGGGRRPGVVVFHDWGGLGPEVKQRAEMLAGLGYVALAADVYGRGVKPKDAAESVKLSGAFKADREALRRRARAALDVLRAHARVDPERLAATGYCFGGGTALELARTGAPLRAVVSFHGFLDTPLPAAAGALKARVLVLHGADDPYVPPEHVAAFQDEMRRAGAAWQAVLYGGAVHAFSSRAAGADRSKGAAYDAEADARSWESMRDFLAAAFR